MLRNMRQCTEMTGFTRLLVSDGGKPDGLMASMPTLVVPQLGFDKTRGFQVINRPWSLQEVLKQPGWAERVKEQVRSSQQLRTRARAAMPDVYMRTIPDVRVSAPPCLAVRVHRRDGPPHPAGHPQSRDAQAERGLLFPVHVARAAAAVGRRQAVLQGGQPPRRAGARAAHARPL